METYRQSGQPPPSTARSVTATAEVAERLQLPDSKRKFSVTTLSWLHTYSLGQGLPCLPGSQTVYVGAREPPPREQ